MGEESSVLIMFIGIFVIIGLIFISNKRSKARHGKTQIEKHNFKANRRIGNYIEFDDEQGKFRVLTNYASTYGMIYDYKDIISFELLQDGESITKGGIGSAVGGAILAGGVGAIVGGVVGTKRNEGISTQLLIKITLRGQQNSLTYIGFITRKTPKKSPKYQYAFQGAQRVLSELQRIVDDEHPEAKRSVEQKSNADQLLEFKKLLDAGAITDEEYNLKKKELLGL